MQKVWDSVQVDVYRALAAAEKPMTPAEISKVAKISKEEAYLGIGWLFQRRKS